MGRLVDTTFITEKIPTVYISQNTEGVEFIDENTFEKVVLSAETIKAYEDALKPDKKFKDRVLAFLTATNKAGRKAKIIKDAALIFLPYGKRISNVSELLTKRILKPMAKSQKNIEKKSPAKSKSVITFTLLAIVGILQLVGIDIGLELSPDAAWVATASGILGVILRAVTGKPLGLGS